MNRNEKLKQGLAGLGNLPKPVGSPARPPRPEKGIGALRQKLGYDKDEPRALQPDSSPPAVLPGPESEASPESLHSNVPRVQQTPHVSETPRVSQTPSVSQTSHVSDTPTPMSETPDTRQTRDISQTPLRVEQVDGYLQLPNTVLDRILPMLSVYEQAVYVRLYRLSWGYGREQCRVSWPTLCETTHMSRSQAQRAVRQLQQLGLLRKEAATSGEVDGNVFWVERQGGVQ